MTFLRNIQKHRDKQESMSLHSQIRSVLRKHKHKLGISSDIRTVSFKNLGFGENNMSIYVNVNNLHEFTFRIAMKRSRKRMLDKEEHMQNEFNILGHLPDAIAPKPYLFDNSKKLIPRAYCILSFVPGKIKSKWTSQDIKLHARALAKLHAKKYSYFEGEKEEQTRQKNLDFYAHYTQNWLAERKETLRDSQVSKILPYFIAYIKKHNHLFLKLKKFTRTHGDLCNDNILFTKKDIVYIDWEWSKINDPARDVARVFNTDFALNPWYVKFSKQQKKLLLKTYLSKDADHDFSKRVDVWNMVLFFSDFLYFKWKLKHFGVQESGYPRRTYLLATKVLHKSLRKRLNQTDSR